MMHVDKNADSHVLDVDRISREISYVPLNERIRSKRNSCMSTRYAYQWFDGFEFLDMLRRGPMDLKFGHVAQRSNGFEI